MTRRRKKRKTSRSRRRKMSKSINLGHGFRLNIGRSGINLSGGVTGARVSVGTKGLKSTLSVPGTDLKRTKTWVSTKDVIDVFKGDDDDKKDSTKDKAKKDTSSKKKAIEQDEVKIAAAKDQERLESLGAEPDSIGDDPKAKAHLPTAADKRILLKKSLKLTPWFILMAVGAGLLFVSLIIGGCVIVIGGVFVISAYFSAEGEAKRLFNQGVDFYKDGKKEAAMELFDSSVEAYKGNADMLEDIAEIKLGQEDYNGAGQLYRTLVVDLKQKKAKFGLAKCYLMTGNSKDAIPLLEPLLEKYQFNEDQLMEVQYLLGQAFMDELEFDKARELLTEVHEKNQEYENIGFLMSRLQ